MNMRRALLGALALLAVSCGTPSRVDPQSKPSVSESPSPRGPVADIHWSDFVRFDGIGYLAYPVHVGKDLPAEDLGPRHAVVRQRLSDTVTDPNYRPQDGDAAFLDPGTPVHAVKGFRPAFRLAARREGRIVVYEVDDNPAATRAEDVLDIEGRVDFVTVHSAQDSRQIAAIRDRAAVATLVREALRGALDPTRHPAEGDRYFVAFRLDDDTAVTRQYLVGVGQLWPGIKVSVEFKRIVLRAVGR